MIPDGEASGTLTAGPTIVDATSGNTGIAYAMVGAARGYTVKLCVPENASPERKLILRALGAELVLTNPLEGTDGAIREVRRLYAEDPGRTSIPTSTATTRTGGRITTRPAPRSSSRPSGRLTHFVAGLGTSGTFVGTGRALRKFNPAIKLISFQPDSPFHGLEGLKHMESAIVPGIYDPDARRRGPARQHRGRARDGAPPGARGRAAGRASRRARRWRRRSRSRAVSSAASGRHGVSRRRGEVPDRELLDGDDV